MNTKFKLLFALLTISSMAFASMKEEMSGSEAENKKILRDFLGDKPREAESRLKALKETDKEQHDRICALTMDANNDFAIIAQEKGMGLSAPSFMRYCNGHKVRQLKTGGIIQKEKPKIPEPKVVKLRPVTFEDSKGEKGGILAQKMQIEKAEQDMRRNAEIIAAQSAEKKVKVMKLTDQMKTSQALLIKAQGFYDNLKVAIMGFRFDVEDPSSGINFKTFKHAEHVDDLPEDYLTALNKALGEGDTGNLNKSSRETLDIATKLLAQSIESIANARADLERINRELMELHEGS